MGRTASTLYSILSLATLLGGVAAMSVPQAACKALFSDHSVPLEVRLLIIAAGATLLPVSQALRTLMVCWLHTQLTSCCTHACINTTQHSVGMHVGTDVRVSLEFPIQ